MASFTLVHQPRAVEALERRLRDEILTANLSRTPVSSADGRFIVERVLGHGASSVVCKAREIKLERSIALKLFPGLPDDALAQAVKREAQDLAKIPHANIVTVHDFGVLKLLPGEHRCFFVAMELGVPLRDWLREQATGPEKVVATFCRVGEGLAAIHAAGFVYRDFKPENVVIVAGVPKIVDFGLALSAATGGDTTGTKIIGTPAFMSPEALRGSPQDARSDQFSFAAALWKALCGELPYDGLSHDPAMRGPLRPPKPTMPEQVLLALRQALDPEPRRRFPDMAELLAALLPVVEPARSSSTTARTQALMLDVESTTELVPLRRPGRRRLAPWLAFPAAGALSVGGVLTAMGFWHGDEGAAEVAVSVDEEDAVNPTGPPPPPVNPGCPDLAPIVGAWRFDTSARWATDTRLFGKVGHYTLDLASDGSACGLQVELRKTGNDNSPYAEPRSDRQRVELVALPPFTGAFAGRFAPKKPGKPTADNIYDFSFIIDGDRLYGDFHAEQSTGERFTGDVQGSREGAAKVETGSRLPCSALCGMRCLGADATNACRLACAKDAWGEARCPAPDPMEKVQLPAESKRCVSAERYAGRWLFLARDRKSRDERAYEVELGADGCDITVKSARQRDRTAPLRGDGGRADASGLWKVALTSGRGAKERVDHEWSLVGVEPAYGEFIARHDGEAVAAGVIAAYRRP